MSSSSSSVDTTFFCSAFIKSCQISWNSSSFFSLLFDAFKIRLFFIRYLQNAHQVALETNTQTHKVKRSLKAESLKKEEETHTTHFGADFIIAH